MAKRSGLAWRWLGAAAMGATMLMGAAGDAAGDAKTDAAADEARRLNREANRLADNGMYNDAVLLAERALGIGEKALGPDHSDVAVLLNNLAVLYQKTRDYARAELAPRTNNPPISQLTRLRRPTSLLRICALARNQTQSCFAS